MKKNLGGGTNKIFKYHMNFHIRTVHQCSAVDCCRTLQHTDTNKDPIHAATPPPY